MFDDLKIFNNQKYSGMTVGGEHHWVYPNGVWDEKKIPLINGSSRSRVSKRGSIPAPEGSGALNGTSYHWFKDLVIHTKTRKVIGRSW
jgi:hypothetical protein